MQKKHLLKHARNNLDQKFFIRENLTLRRRLLKERVDKELHSFQFKWVKNGNILVRKNKWSRAVKVVSEEVLDMLKNQSKEGHAGPASGTSASKPKTMKSRIPSQVAMSQPTERVPSYFSNNRVGSSLTQPLPFVSSAAHSVFVADEEFV